MEKDNIKEDEIRNDMEEAAVEAVNTVEESDRNEEDNFTEDAVYDEESLGKNMLANILDQLLLVATSSLLVLLCDLILKLFGYMFVKDNGSIFLAGIVIYFILNCIYSPIMNKARLEGTIAKKILSI